MLIVIAFGKKWNLYAQHELSLVCLNIILYDLVELAKTVLN